jgi:MoxR-like ATPase
MVRVAGALGARRGLAVTDWDVGLDAALVALSGRIRLREGSGRDPETVIRELYTAVFAAPEPDGGDAPGGA